MSRIDIAVLLIHLVVGFTMLCFGLSQLINPKGWTQYLPKWLAAILPFKPTTVLRLHSLGNVSLGLLFMSTLWPVIVAYLVAAWWTFIFPFAFRQDRYIALRDLSIIAAIVATIVLKQA